jgi:hypothetical protein
MRLLQLASSWSSIFTLPTLMMHGQTQIKFTHILFRVFLIWTEDRRTGRGTRCYAATMPSALR